MTITFAVTLKSGGDFSPYDAQTLARQVRKHMTYPHRFVCMTDMVDDFPIEHNMPYLTNLEHGYPGWWSMIEMFRLAGPVVASGLDMIVLDNIDRLAELALTCRMNEFYMARPQKRAFSKGEKWCSGLQIWNGDWSWLYKTFAHNPKLYMSEFVKEQRFTYTHLMQYDHLKIKAVQDYFDGYYSYKNQCRKSKPEDARVVLFHGNPRPKDCKDKWVKEVYYNKYEYKHPYEEMKNGVNQTHGKN